MRTEEVSSLASKFRAVSALTSSTESSVRRSECLVFVDMSKRKLGNVLKLHFQGKFKKLAGFIFLFIFF